jgi:hypothetical protein
VYACSCIGDVEIAKCPEEKYGCSEEEVLEPSDE